MSLLSLNSILTYAKAAMTNLQRNAGGRYVVAQKDDLSLVAYDGTPISTGAPTMAAGVATFLATPSSVNLKAAVTDETGSGALVFANTPTLVTPAIGAATGTSLVLTGDCSGASFIPTGTAIPTNGMYLLAANQTAISSNGVRWVSSSSTLTSFPLDIQFSQASQTTLRRGDVTGYLHFSGGGAVNTGMNWILGGQTTSSFAALAVLRFDATELVKVSASQFKINEALDLVMPKASGKGFKVDYAAPTYPWRDKEGPILVRGVGATDPSFNVFRGVLRAYQFTVNDEAWLYFHMPHDYAPGTDIHVHAHWAHASAGVSSGSVTWEFTSSYSKGHNQAAFPAEVTTTVAQTASTTQYQHMIAETPISVAGGSASLLNSTNFEPAGIIVMRCRPTANTMTATPEPFLFTVDLHYQSTSIGTKQKAPNFYV